jgi:predicted ester cyclase
MAAAIMTGQHTGISNGIDPTGASIVHKQVHLFTISGGQITRHRAIRDARSRTAARLEPTH